MRAAQWRTLDESSTMEATEWEQHNEDYWMRAAQWRTLDESSTMEDTG